MSAQLIASILAWLSCRVEHKGFVSGVSFINTKRIGRKKRMRRMCMSESERLNQTRNSQTNSAAAANTQTACDRETTEREIRCVRKVRMCALYGHENNKMWNTTNERWTGERMRNERSGDGGGDDGTRRRRRRRGPGTMSGPMSTSTDETNDRKLSGTGCSNVCTLPTFVR